MRELYHGSINLMKKEVPFFMSSLNMGPMEKIKLMLSNNLKY